MDSLVFKLLRGAAILFYLAAVILGLFALYLALVSTGATLAGLTLEPDIAPLLLPLVLIPVGIGIAFDRLAAIGTDQAR